MLAAGVALWSFGTLIAPPAAQTSLLALCASRVLVSGWLCSNLQRDGWHMHRPPNPPSSRRGASDGAQQLFQRLLGSASVMRWHNTYPLPVTARRQPALSAVPMNLVLVVHKLPCAWSLLQS